ncbi:MAG: protein translocase subunit SecF [Pseudomonadota bacterium]
MLTSLQFFKTEPKIPFLRFRTIAAGASAIAFVASVLAFTVLGLNFGIDFRGGTLIEIRTEEPADLAQIRQTVGGLGLGDVQVQEFGQPTDVLIIVERQRVSGGTEEENEAAQQAVVDSVKAALNAALSAVEYRRVEVVGGRVSDELRVKGTIAVTVAVALMLIYIWLRFEWQFSVGAVLALVHDVVLTIGIFALLRIEFNLSIIAALLTIVGYSMNDTVVIYDRIREKLRKYKKMPLEELINFALNKTLARTLMTSVTTLLALFSLFFLGGEVIRGFTFAMIWGVLIGTYSSLFIAAPFLLMTGVKRDWSAAQASTVQTGA